MAFTAAKYPGWCAICGERIEPGDMIGYDTNGTQCEDCYDGKPESAAPTKTPCQTCWTIHEGECL